MNRVCIKAWRVKDSGRFGLSEEWLVDRVNWVKGESDGHVQIECVVNGQLQHASAREFYFEEVNIYKEEVAHDAKG